MSGSTLFVTVGFGAVGFFDDYQKLTRRSSRGLPGRMKLLAEIAIAAVGALAIVMLTRGTARDIVRGAVLQERTVQSRLVLRAGRRCW